jgi:Phage tail lysozyme
MIVGSVTMNGRDVGTLSVGEGDEGTDRAARAASGSDALASLSPPGLPRAGAPHYGASAGPSGSHDVPRGPSGGPSPAMSADRRQVAATAAKEWRAAGMSETGIAGVMANIQQESNFNPTLRHPDQPHWSGEAHFAHGLYQEGGEEWNRYAGWLGKNYPGANWQDPKLQSEFAAQNLKANYPKVWAAMQGARSREEAASAYAAGYLKPAANYLASRIAGFRSRGVPPTEAFTGPQPQPTAAAPAGASPL